MYQSFIFDYFTEVLVRSQYIRMLADKSLLNHTHSLPGVPGVQVPTTLSTIMHFTKFISNLFKT